jgi:YesN/AraC family two-component response regulator
MERNSESLLIEAFLFLKYIGQQMYKVCIVEDERVIALDLMQVLYANGCTVCTIADNFNDAVKAAMDFQPDLFIMDINLAGDLDGIDAASSIQQFLETNFIFSSSDAQTLHADRLSEISYLDYLTKPIDEERLNELLYSCKLPYKKNISSLHLSMNLMC